MKKQILNFILAGVVLLTLSSCQNEYKKASADKRLDMAEFLASPSGSQENQALSEIMYSMVELSPDGFKLNATKQDFIDKGLDTYWYYAMRDSLKETYKKLKKGGFEVPQMPGVDWIQQCIETFNKQKEEFWASVKE